MVALNVRSLRTDANASTRIVLISRNNRTDANGSERLPRICKLEVIGSIPIRSTEDHLHRLRPEGALRARSVVCGPRWASSRAGQRPVSTDDPAGVGRRLQRGVVALVLVGVGLGERRERPVEGVARAEVARDRDRVARAGVRAGERLPAELRVDVASSSAPSPRRAPSPSSPRAGGRRSRARPRRCRSCGSSRA